GVRGGAVLGRAAGPAARAHWGDHVGPGDVRVAVGVLDLAGPLVDRIVQVGEGDPAVGVDVRQVGAHPGRNLGLVEPEVIHQIGMVVINPGVDVGDDHAGQAGGGIPGRGGIGAPGAVEGRLVARGELRVVGPRLEADG